MESKQRELVDMMVQNIKLSFKGTDEDLLTKMELFLHMITLYEEANFNISDDQINLITQLLEHDSLLVKTKAAKILTSLAKDPNFRQKSVDKKIAPLLCNLIKTVMDDKSNIKVILHSDEDLLTRMKLFLYLITLCEGENLNISDEQINLITQLLEHDSLLVKAKAAKILASLAKDANFRQNSVDKKIAPLLCNLIRTAMCDKSGVNVILHSCRALGNLCYENASNRQYVTVNNGFSLLLEVIRFVNELSNENEKLDTNKEPEVNKSCSDKKVYDCKNKYAHLRSVSLGLLLNYMAGQDDIFPATTNIRVVDLIVDCLRFGIAGKHEEAAAIHAVTLLSIFAELYSMHNKTFLNPKICLYLTKFIQQSEPGELVELCIDLAHSQTANDDVPLLLAKCEMVDAVIDFVEKYEDKSSINDARNLFKVACDLIILVLSADDAMRYLYQGGVGKEYKKLLKWVHHENKDFRITSVLAIGNFGRSDANCTEMTNAGVHRILYNLLREHNTAEADMKIQHALLSAFKNLAIPSRNKEILFDMGILEALYPMLPITSYPIVFKLIGVMRMLVNGQEKAANELGKNVTVVRRLVEWCYVTDHSGVTGESCRLIAWIITNSQDEEVMRVMLACNVLPYLVNMITSPHIIMQGEGLASLINLSSLRLKDAGEALTKLDIGNVLKNYLLKSNPKLELFHCMLALLEQICSSEQIRNYLRQCEFHATLKTLSQKSEYAAVKETTEGLIHRIEKE